MISRSASLRRSECSPHSLFYEFCNGLFNLIDGLPVKSPRSRREGSTHFKKLHFFRLVTDRCGRREGENVTRSVWRSSAWWGKERQEPNTAWDLHGGFGPISHFYPFPFPLALGTESQGVQWLKSTLLLDAMPLKEHVTPSAVWDGFTSFYTVIGSIKLTCIVCGHPSVMCHWMEILRGLCQ